MNDALKDRMPGERKERRGFASMTPEKQREIASKGGRAAHQKGTAHEWTSDEARSAGRKGGQISRGGRGRLVDEPSPAAEPGIEAGASSGGSTGATDGTAVGRITEACAYVVKRVAMVMVVALGCAAAASAQNSTTASGQATPQSSLPGDDNVRVGFAAEPGTPSGESETRPATTTFEGDTGLWFVPTGEVLPAKKWSLSAYRVNFDRDQGFTDVSNWPVTAGIGLADRAEIFGAFTVVRRIDRDVRPVFVATQPRAGGLANEYPFVRQGWSDNQLGDFTIGAKVNLLSEWRQAPVAFAVRAQLKLPTAKDDEEGVGTGKTDFSFDAILSKEINQRVELSGYAGYIVRGDPSGVDLSNGFRWGVGAGLPSRGRLRLTAELHGESYSNDTLTLTTPIIGQDGSISPLVTDLTSPVNATFGLTWQARNGFFAGAGINWNLHMDARNNFFSGFDNRTGDSSGFQMRLGYHPGVRVYVPPPPPAAGPPAAPAAAAQRCR